VSEDPAIGPEDPEVAYAVHLEQLASDRDETNMADRASKERLRGRQAISRDETARLRDLTAHSRDLAAEARDRAATRQAEAQALPPAQPSADAAALAVLAAGETLRADAAADRERAASDRQRGATDREQAAADRSQSRIDLQRAHLDSLTGVYMRDLGNVTIQHEIDRSRRSGEPFVLAFVDVDGLKAINDSDGHAAGDTALRSVAAALKSELRSYDPIVRIGGDEFLCGFTNTKLVASMARVEQIRRVVAAGPGGLSITVGLAELQSDDTFGALAARADRDMYENKPA
jgi:diguanylate cyclase (GGDEF)-like protein